MLSIREALDLMLPEFQPLGSESLPLLAAHTRVLSKDICAQFDLPEFDNSAMDGYALRHADVSAGSVLPIQMEVRAGGAFPAALLPGHIARIFTGAPLPAYADTVVIQENVQRSGETVMFRELPKAFAHVRKRGTDVSLGAVLMRAGDGLGPGEIGLLAAQGRAHVEVYRRPRVAILPTGDELREIDAERVPGSIVNSNAYALAAAVQEAGCEPLILPIARDRPEDIARRIEQGLRADVLLSIGGVSVGDYDLVSRALREAGVQIGFHKVAIKPGKPLLFGKRGSQPVVGLPGNPVSALVTFAVFVRPCLQQMLGHRAAFQEPLDVSLSEAYEHAAGRTELVRARLFRKGSDWHVKLHERQGSAALSSMVGQDALVILPADTTHFAVGERLCALRIAAPRAVEPPFQ
jgi:molybdopterin molybdotransferase